jgi:hypothetical protein
MIRPSTATSGESNPLLAKVEATVDRLVGLAGRGLAGLWCVPRASVRLPRNG